ncbi:hypothetical protein [Bradyrhizobium tunisiense]|uniref:hypothetical protein n=1 Tax=Bradyrhizobium tunisiense TaxID=3278709 RepID=UPI0035D66898
MSEPASCTDRRKGSSGILGSRGPVESDALSETRKTHLQSEKARRHAEEQEVDGLRYQAPLAERQLNRVDPDNRLVTGELDRRWEAALFELRRAEEALVPRKMSQANEPWAFLVMCVPRWIALGDRLPTLWDNPATCGDHREALLRCRIVKVVLRRCARDKPRCASSGAVTQPLSFWSHYRLMPWLPCRGTKKWLSACAR